MRRLDRRAWAEALPVSKHLGNSPEQEKGEDLLGARGESLGKTIAVSRNKRTARDRLAQEVVPDFLPASG